MFSDATCSFHATDDDWEKVVLFGRRLLSTPDDDAGKSNIFGRPATSTLMTTGKKKYYFGRHYISFTPLLTTGTKTIIFRAPTFRYATDDDWEKKAATFDRPLTSAVH
ncbi:hypothetical protein AVEN_226556-1 [Araneus ventricosus]|uniref:Uncharacterized protein n=1 Tax=Araneus ventricosus TaxID=182803 RepID=A0A4Y2MEE8_ARAVE|nr:hypothetical protein AVEN_226556-1 [Araneus ventricosus]